MMINEAKKPVKLNLQERLKLECSPHDYLKEIENLAFDMIGDNDRIYLQSAGIYNHEAEEDSFALRLRLNAGRISSEQLLLIAKIVKAYDLEIILTVRAQMQIHGLDSDNILEVWKMFNENGISTWQTFGDNVRNIVTDVYDGRGVYSEIEVYPYIAQMQDYILNNAKFVGLLPRRVSVAISGNRANLNTFFANDLFFALAEKEGLKGFNVYLGGKNAALAQDANVFLQAHQVVAYFIAVVEAFHQHGLRAKRGKTRIINWIEHETLEGVKKRIDEAHTLEYETRGTLLLEKYDKERSTRLKDGRYVYVYSTDFGRVTAEDFETLATFATSQKAEVRLGIDQHIYVLGMEKEVKPLLTHNKTKTLVACAGSQHCTFSFWNIKDDTALLPLSRIQKHHIHLGFSGCLKGCAKHQHCDIGLVGMKTSTYGEPAEAARVFVGGEHSLGLSVARYLNILVPKEAVGAFVSVIIDTFEQSHYAAFEDFSKEVLNTYSADFLCLWFLLQLTEKVDVEMPCNSALLDEKCSEVEKMILYKAFPKHIFTTNFDATSEIQRLSQSLWAQEAK